LAARNDDGYVGGTDVEAIEQLLNAGIAVQVENAVGMPVACEELTNAERPLPTLRSENHDVADAAGDQLHAPQHEGAHEDRAQLAVGLDEGQQLVATDFDDFAVRSRPDLGEPPAARQHGRLAGKHPGAERDDDLL